MAEEPGTELGAGAEQTGLGGGYGDPEFGCNGFEGELIEVAQDERIAEQFGKPLYLFADDGVDLAPVEDLLRVKITGLEMNCGAVFAGEGLLADADKADPAGLAQVHEALVVDNAGQPGGEFGVTEELRDVLPGLGEGILYGIFGRILILENRKSEASRGRRAILNELRKRRGVTCAGQVHEPALFIGKGNWAIGCHLFYRRWGRVGV